MKRFIMTVAAVLAGFMMMNGQGLKEANEAARTASAALSQGDYVSALAGFQSALKVAQECGKNGEKLVDVCKGIIPKTMAAIANQKLIDKDYDGALFNLHQALLACNEYGDDATKADIDALLPQVYVVQGASLADAGSYEAAAEAFAKARELNPADGLAALREGLALEGAGKGEEAVAAYKEAAENGQEHNATLQLGKYNIKSAVDAFNSKNYEKAVSDALASNNYVANPQTLQIAGQASQLLGKNTDAIIYFTDYMKAAPEAENYSQIAYTVGAIYQQMGDKAKAKEFFEKAGLK